MLPGADCSSAVPVHAPSTGTQKFTSANCGLHLGGTLRERMPTFLDAAAIRAADVAQQSLFYAIDNDLLSASSLAVLLEQGADLRAPFSRSFPATALYIAVMINQLEIASILLAADANVDLGILGGPTPLQLCMEHGDFTIGSLLVNSHADLDLASGGLMSPLMFACVNGHTSCVRLLIEANADVEQTRSFESNCSPEAKESAGRVALHMACWSGAKKADIVRLLIDTRANVNAVDEAGRSPLFLNSMYEAPIDPEAPKIAAMLLAARADVELQMCAPNSGATALYASAIYGSPHVMRLLLEADASVEVRCKCGATPMFASVQEGNLMCVKLLSLYNAPRHGVMDGIDVTAEGFADGTHQRAIQEDVLQWLQSSDAYSCTCSPLQRALVHFDVMTEKHALNLLEEYAHTGGWSASCMQGEELAEMNLQVFGMVTAHLARRAPHLDLDKEACLRSANVGDDLAAAAMLVRAFGPWSIETHALWPHQDRRHAAQLCRLGHLIAYRLLPDGSQGTFIDAFLHHVITHVLTLETRRHAWSDWLKSETQRQRLRDAAV